jgi:hypothetical protein
MSILSAAGRRLRRAARAGARGTARAAPTAIELAGYALLAGAGWTVAPALGMAIAGVACLVISQGIEGSRLMRAAGRIRRQPPGVPPL